MIWKFQDTPFVTTKQHKRKQPEGPLRGGLEDGPSRTDQEVMTGKNNDNEKSLRKCSCGWEKVTSHRDLHIHQGKMKCRRQTDQRPCTAQAGQTIETQSRDCTHSAAGPSGTEMSKVVEGNPMMEKAPSENKETSLPKVHPTKPMTKQPGRRSKI